MSSVLRWLGRTLPAGAAALVLAACSNGSPMPSSASAVSPPSPRTVSGIVHGWVVDTANRPVANANIECASNAQCTLFGDISAQDGRDQGVKTDAKGYYELVLSPTGPSPFLMNASARGYGIVWQKVALPDAGCTFDQSRCAMTLNFTLSVVE